MSIYVELVDYNNQRERDLRERLSQLHRGGAAISYYQLQGLLFATVCSPEPIKPSEWFDLIWLDDDPQFDDERDAGYFYQAVLALAEHISGMARQQRFLPFAPLYEEASLVNLGEWCEGLLLGHQYLEDLWTITLDDLDDQGFIEDIEAVLNLAATFADHGESRQMSLDGEMELSSERLPDAYELFRKVLPTYATVGSLWAEHSWEFDTEQLFLALEPVPRESMCPCGSGLIFAKCCLH